MDALKPKIRADKNIKMGITLKKFKLLGAVMMMLSAFGTTVIPHLFGGLSNSNMWSLTAAVVCEVISWSALPWYAWLLVRGYQNTHNLNLYTFRLLILALICEVPYDFTTFGCAFDMRSQNPVFGLVIALFVLSGIDMVRARFKGAQKVASIAVILIAGILWNLFGKVGFRQNIFWGGALLLGFVLIFRFLENHEIRMELIAGAFGAMSLLAPGVGVAVLHYRSPYGDGPKQTKQFRWLMYAWYPLMLVIASAFTILL